MIPGKAYIKKQSNLPQNNRVSWPAIEIKSIQKSSRVWFKKIKNAKTKLYNQSHGEWGCPMGEVMKGNQLPVSATRGRVLKISKLMPKKFQAIDSRKGLYKEVE